MSDVLYDVRDHVATITLNRPERLNAVTHPMYDDLHQIIDETDADDAVRAIVLTGAGRAFCAGADLGRGDSTFDYGVQDDEPVPDKGGAFALRLYSSLKPIIAAINGPAVGFGASVTLPADIRLMADTARIGFVYGARGIAPEGTSSWFLPRLIGLPIALEWCLTARMVSADEAVAAGLARSIHPIDELMNAAYGLAQTIATSVAPVSAVVIRRLLWRMSSAPVPAVAHPLESAAVHHLGQLADAKEGIASFLERRAPAWTLAPSSDLPAWLLEGTQP